MLGWLTKVFRKKDRPPPFDIEKAVGHYLLTLPRCSNRVLVVSRRYLDKRYNYELTVDAANLADWSVKHAKGAGRPYGPDQAVRKTLPLWLHGADLSDSAVTFPPKEFFSLLREYQETFLNMASAQVYCHECHQIIENVTKKITELPPRDIFEFRRFEWFCRQGHLLYKEDHGVHFDARTKKYPRQDQKLKEA